MASSQVETVSTGADKAKLVAAGALVLGALVAFYFLSSRGSLAQWSALIVCLVAAVAVGCEPHLVLTGKGEAHRGHPLPDTFPAQTTVHADLSAFVDHLLARETEAN